jgi:hypothetical protein
MTNKRKFKKGAKTTDTTKAVNATVAPKRKAETDKLFDKNYLSGFGKFVSKVKNQVVKSKGE